MISSATTSQEQKRWVFWKRVGKYSTQFKISCETIIKKKTKVWTQYNSCLCYFRVIFCAASRDCPISPPDCKHLAGPGDYLSGRIGFFLSFFLFLLLSFVITEQLPSFAQITFSISCPHACINSLFFHLLASSFSHKPVTWKMFFFSSACQASTL